MQTPPKVVSINRSAPTGTTGATSVSFTVTFSTDVSGVDPADFAVVLSGVTANATVAVVPVSGSVYTVTVNGVSGDGTLGVNLVDDGSIRDAAQNRLAAADGQAAFRNQQTYAAGTNPIAVAVGDVNGDGKPDVVLANNAASSVSVLLGNGDGSFRSQQTFSALFQPYAIALGDVNGDGRADLILANSGVSNIAVFLGNGDGAFNPPQLFPTGNQPHSVVLGDINGDGKPDVVTANYGGGGSVSVLLGAGNGALLPMQTFATGTAPRSVALGDVNGDGKPDLAVANYDNNWVGVLLGNGDGTLKPQRTFATGSNPWSVAIGDVNGDGNLDLAVANNVSSVSVLLGNGSGNFSPQQAFPAGSIPRSVSFGDVNGDGRLDLVVANSHQSTGVTASVLLGNGNGTFRPAQSFAAGQLPRAVATADFNADGKLDLVVANGTDNSLSVLLGNGNGAFTGQTYTITPAAATNTSLAANPNATTGGTLVTFTATIAPSPSNLGTVTFRDNGTPLAAATNLPIIAGVATFTTSQLTSGMHSISAAYSGAAGFAPSASNPLNFTVSAAATMTTLSAGSPNPANAADAIAFTVTVAVLL